MPKKLKQCLICDKTGVSCFTARWRVGSEDINLLNIYLATSSTKQVICTGVLCNSCGKYFNNFKTTKKSTRENFDLSSALLNTIACKKTKIDKSDLNNQQNFSPSINTASALEVVEEPSIIIMQYC